MMRLAAMERAYHKNGFNGSNGHVASGSAAHRQNFRRFIQ
jgi:hypothetical protein